MLVTALVIGGLFLVIGGAVKERTYLEYRSVARERAYAVAESPGQQTNHCGKVDHQKVDVTFWIEGGAREGFPAWFVAVQCPRDVQLGQIVTIARKSSAQTHPEVSFDPPGSQREVAAFAARLGLAGTGLVLVLFLIRKGFLVALDLWAEHRRW